MQTMSAKEPWLSVWLSSILTGLGQIYSGNRPKGISFMIVSAVLVLSAISCLFWFAYTLSMTAAILTLIFGSCSILFAVYNSLDAFLSAKAYNYVHQTDIPSRKKQPFLAAFLSTILPGLGQLYNNQWLKGIGVFIGMILLSKIQIIHPLGFYITKAFEIFITLWAILDAYFQASKLNGEEANLFTKFGKQKVIVVLALWILMPTLIAGNAASFFRANFLASYKVPTNSMATTLIKGDKIFSDVQIYKNEEPKRGDLIVFRYPLNPKQEFIKRVIGLPNETVKIENGNIYINGELIDTPEIPRDRIYSNREDWPYGKAGQTIQVPADSYFTLGDNTQATSDSRYWGFVPRKNITGKVYSIWWPKDRWQKFD